MLSWHMEYLSITAIALQTYPFTSPAVSEQLTKATLFFFLVREAEFGFKIKKA